MTNLFPAAGLGQRFADKGYTIPKPLLPVSGAPMIIQAMRSAPPSDHWVCVFRTETVRDQHVDRAITAANPAVTIITVDKPTEGQACTCLLAQNAVSKDEPLYIGSVDAGMVYDVQKYQRLLAMADTDVIVWAFTKHPALPRNPKAWGWIKPTPEGTVTGVSVKVPISETPFNDHAIIGSFTFKTGALFITLANELIRRNIRVNNEFYVDSILNLAIELGHKVKMFVVDKYIGWGVPADYEEYLAWEKAIAAGTADAADPMHRFWHEFFTQDIARFR